MNLPRLLPALAVAALLSAPAGLLASGSYCVCLPKPPPKSSAAKQADRDKYDLGQKVYNGKTAPATGDAAAQRARLQTLQASLPEKVAKKKDLTALAGKLTAEQLDALEHYVGQRYPKAK